MFQITCHQNARKGAEILGRVTVFAYLQRTLWSQLMFPLSAYEYGIDTLPLPLWNIEKQKFKTLFYWFGSFWKVTKCPRGKATNQFVKRSRGNSSTPDCPTAHFCYLPGGLYAVLESSTSSKASSCTLGTSARSFPPIFMLIHPVARVLFDMPIFFPTLLWWEITFSGLNSHLISFIFKPSLHPFLLTSHFPKSIRSGLFWLPQKVWTEGLALCSLCQGFSKMKQLHWVLRTQWRLPRQERTLLFYVPLSHCIIHTSLLFLCAAARVSSSQPNDVISIGQTYFLSNKSAMSSDQSGLCHIFSEWPWSHFSLLQVWQSHDLTQWLLARNESEGASTQPVEGKGLCVILVWCFALVSLDGGFPRWVREEQTVISVT